MRTIREIAGACGVSNATVSRVLNERGEVSPDTRERILEVIERSGYTPSRAARALKTQETGLLTFILPEILNPLHCEVAKHLEFPVREHNYELMLGASLAEGEIETRYMQIALEKRVDGIFYTPFSMKIDPEGLRFFVDERVPIVALHRIPGMEDIDYVTLNEYDGAVQVTDHLLRLGHKRIAFIAGGVEISCAEERINGLIDCHRRHGQEYDRNLVFPCGGGVEDGYLAASKALKTGPVRPTAIFALNDLLAMGAYKAVADAGLAIPGDVSIVGFDDIPFSQYLNPPLTTVTFDKVDFARTATEFLLNRIAAYRRNLPLPWQRRVIKPSLVVRRSTC
jgi:LacI family transcriptional regulator